MLLLLLFEPEAKTELWAKEFYEQYTIVIHSKECKSTTTARDPKQGPSGICRECSPPFSKQIGKQLHLLQDIAVWPDSTHGKCAYAYFKILILRFLNSWRFFEKQNDCPKCLLYIAIYMYTYTYTYINIHTYVRVPALRHMYVR